MVERQTTRTIVIAGGGTAGWMAAAALVRFLPAGDRVVLVESDTIGTIGVGEATIPQLRLFHQGLGIDEGEFLRATGGTIKLGIAFEGWSGADSRYVHAFGTVGRGLGLVPFQHYWRRAGGTDLGAYVTAAVAGQANRFAPDPGSAQAPTGIAWAYHLDAVRYAAFLRDRAERDGAVRVEGRIDAVEPDARGGIAALMLADGRRIEGDLFLDCTGFASLLLGEALGSPWDDWSRWLPCDRAIAVQGAGDAAPVPYTRAIAHGAGWRWRIPLRTRTGNGLVYSSAYLSDDRAAGMLDAALGGTGTGDPRAIRFATGRRRDAWRGNCVALGLAAGFLEPLESTSIHLVQSGIARLLALWPADPACPETAVEYNRATAAEWAGVRDFLVLHYHLNDRDEPFWRDRRATPLPDHVRERIDLFAATGALADRPGELFTDAAWLQVMVGQGVRPAAWSPLADALPADRLSAFLDAVRAIPAQAVAHMPAHADFLAALDRRASIPPDAKVTS